jgi:hypothetical protein
VVATSSFARIRWQPIEPASVDPAAASLSPFGLEAARPAVDAQRDALAATLAAIGWPRHPDPAATVKDEAEFLLQAAAEVEHQFIVQYLYAAFSLDRDRSTIADEWFQHLDAIAKEEMGHLLTVQNLLTLLGRPGHFGRERSPAPEGTPFPLSLQPFGLPFVSRFLVAESPIDAELPDDLGDRKATIDHVGVLYAMLYWLFQDGNAPQEPWILPVDHLPQDRHLAPPDYGDAATVAEIVNRASEWSALDDVSIPGIHVLPPEAAPLSTPAEMADAARRAIYDVAVQGEGPAGDPDPGADSSHYHRLLAIYVAVKAHAGALPVRDVPTDPRTEPADGADPEQDPVVITDARARTLARAFDIRYERLLLDIALAAETPRSRTVDGQSLRQILALEWAIFTEMVQGIAPLARLLVTLPLKASQSGAAPPFAGPPFASPADSLSNGELARWRRQLTLIEEALVLAAEEPDVLGNLAEIDRLHLPFVQARIAELEEDPG